MYTVSVRVKGISPLMQHRFPMPDYETTTKSGQVSTGEKKWHEEWREALYVDKDGEVFQPATHFESAMLKAASSFKIRGKRGKTYKDLFAMAVIVSPDEIPHNVKMPDTLTTDADEQLYIDQRPVKIQKARVVRTRPTFKTGWELEFEIQVSDDELQSDVVYEVLSMAGKSVGIGDYRPRFGRFQVVSFEVLKG